MKRSNAMSRGTDVMRGLGLAAAMVLFSSAVLVTACDDGGGDGDDQCIELSGALTEDVTLSEACYLVVDDVYVDDGFTLTVEPGVTVRFMQDTGIEIDDEGALSAVGTGSEPVMFTGEETVRGYWKGLYFNNSNSIGNRIAHAVVEYAGGWDYSDGFQAALFLDDSGYDVSVAVESTTVRQSEGHGIHLSANAQLPTFASNTITENTLGPVFAEATAVEYLDATSSYTGNDVDLVEVRPTYVSLSTDAAWQDLDADYLMLDVLWIEESGHLTIEEGTTLLFAQNAGIDIDGALTAQGTASAPITFTGETQTPGFWNGLYFYNTNLVGNVLDHVEVSYGGGYEFSYATYANIALGSSGYDVEVTITNSTISHSEGWGLWVDVDGTVNADVETSNTFTDNASGDYFHE